MEMTAKAVERLDLENDLRQALKRGEFILHYQPIVSCREDRIIGVEALIRWQRTENGLVPPAQFIPIAEETGLIVPIGEWMLRSACTQLAHWHSLGFSELRMAANLSPRQFQQKDVVRIVAHALNSAGLAPRHLELEITESVLAQGSEAEALLREISSTGVRFSLDDFGTGYSSLSYLKRFPIDSLKIDRSFVRDIPGDADDSAIALAIIAMAHSLGIQVVAEGVETAAQLGFVRSHACDGMQGYYLCKPLPADAVTALLLEGRCFFPPGEAKTKSQNDAKPRKKTSLRKASPARKK
jgi:EAL domain-containing protein (putative c-di-GMP-specific phosphodiesterase class I)